MDLDLFLHVWIKEPVPSTLWLRIVSLLYILSLCKAEKDLSQEQDVTGTVTSILKAVLIIKKHGKRMELSVVLTLTGRQVSL